ncbi:methyltransferase [Nocardia sp. NBC_00511]|uniref:methyltransferase n=1 Tax=Nocardia sp. NBC_00511 TaxID=2903591 RepID=UPI0030DE5030
MTNALSPENSGASVEPSATATELVTNRPTAAVPAAPVVRWTEDGQAQSAAWRSENGSPAPAEVTLVDDRLTADAAYRLAAAGTAMLWRGDFHNSRQLLQALGRRVDGERRARCAPTPAAEFLADRRRQAHRAAMLGRLLVRLEPGWTLSSLRAPDVRRACDQAYGAPASTATLVSLRELLGVLGASEWRRKGVDIPALGARIHPHYGVFSPVRGEYVDLVAAAPLPSHRLAFDIGTGTGVLAAVLAQRGVQSIVATDQDPRALACARANLDRLGHGDRVELIRTDLYPPGRAPLVVCNPPWLPAKPQSPLDHAVYDPGSRMLRAFLDRLGKHLTAEGEAWLIISDLAERLGLRPDGYLPTAFEASGLRVIDRLDTRPRHPRAADQDDPLHAARAGEITSLWRLTRN